MTPRDHPAHKTARRPSHAATCFYRCFLRRDRVHVRQRQRELRPERSRFFRRERLLRRAHLLCLPVRRPQSHRGAASQRRMPRGRLRRRPTPPGVRHLHGGGRAVFAGRGGSCKGARARRVGACPLQHRHAPLYAHVNPRERSPYPHPPRRRRERWVLSCCFQTATAAEPLVRAGCAWRLLVVGAGGTARLKR